MKRTALLLAFLCLPVALYAQTGMVPQYAAYQALSIDQNTNTAYATVTVQGTTNPYNCNYVCGPGGVQSQIPGCVGAMHTPMILNQYDSIGGWQTGQGQSPGAYINYSTTIAIPLDFVHGSQTIGKQGAKVICTGLGGSIFNWWFDFEFAFTRADWNGAPPPTCVGTNPVRCTYPVVNNCTPATTPPDLGMLAVEAGDYRGIATYLSWMNVAPCARITGVTPWVCSKRTYSQLQGINGTKFPPFACTKTP